MHALRPTLKYCTRSTAVKYLTALRRYSMSANNRSEEYSGIVAFANNEAGFQGILKQRYSDFIVREIDPSGAVAQLTSLSGKDLQTRSFPAKEKADTQPEALAEFVASLRALVPIADETAEGLTDFITKASARHEDCPESFIVCGSTDKPTRSAIHQLFKTRFKGAVESDTTQVNGVSSLRIQPCHKLKQGWNNRAHEEWPAGLPSHLKFVLAKENCDTASAVSVLTKFFRCGADSIKYAGTKDKRGVTFQFMTVYRRKPSDVNGLNGYRFPPTIRAGNFQYVEEPLSLGCLSGNRFEITLRDVTASASDLEKMCTALKHSGFINYFGLQRFGVGGNPNQDIGLALFLGNYRRAIDLIFADKESDRPEVVNMKTSFRNGEFKEAAKLCPRYMSIERGMLEHLSRHPNDFMGAIGTAPRASILMYAHAYQSHIWNKAVTYRVQNHGLHVIEGDLVGGDSSLGDEDEAGLSGDAFTRVSTMHQSTMAVVSAEDVAANRYSIEDVVLPLPGNSVVLPNNSVAAYFEGLLTADGISSSHFKDSAPPQFRMKGTYRRIIQGAHDLSWKIVEYSDANTDINITELKALDDARPPPKKRGREGEEDAQGAASKASKVDEMTTPLTAASSNETENLKTRVALSIDFSLPPGTYATMLLRELTKQSMEKQFHSGMTADNADPVGPSDPAGSEGERKPSA